MRDLANPPTGYALNTSIRIICYHISYYPWTWNVGFNLKKKKNCGAALGKGPKQGCHSQEKKKIFQGQGKALYAVTKI